MTLFFLLLGKEFQGKPRRRWFYVKRLLYVGGGGIIILIVFTHQWHSHSNKAGLVMFEWLSLMVIATAFLVAPNVAATMIVSEKETGTLNLLLLSDISTAQLLVGKLCASVSATFLTMASIVPLFILCVSLGGINVEQVLLAFPVLATTIFSGTCLGMFVSCFIERESRMQKSVALAAVIFYLLVPGGIALLGLYLQFDVTKVLVVVSPVLAMRTLARAEHLDLIRWHCICNAAAASPLLITAWRLLPALQRRPGGFEAMLRLWRRRHRFFDRPGPIKKRPPVTGNPVIWKDLHVHYGGETGAWKRLIVGCSLMSLAVFFCYIVVVSMPTSKIQFELRRLCWLVSLSLTLLCGINYLYGTVSRAAFCLSREKNMRTLDLLLTTDISAYGLVVGKSNAISLVLLPWTVGFACSSIAFLFFSLLQRELNLLYVLIVAAAILNLVCMVFAYEYIAVYVSMRFERYAAAAALSGFAAWYLVGNTVLALLTVLLSPFTFYLSIIAMPVGVPVLIGNYFRNRLIQDFPKLVERGMRQ